MSSPPVALSSACPRVVGMLVGDIVRSPAARTKYGALFEAIGQQCPLVEVYDVSLRGVPRLVNALMVAHPNGRVWREQFYKNVPAFRKRSELATRRQRQLRDRADVVFQVGVMFDSRLGGGPLPNVVYTDYTARLAARKPRGVRLGLRPGIVEQWIELERCTFERAAHICVRSEQVRVSVIDDYNIPAERVTTVGGGVNLPRLPELIVRPERDPTVLFVGKELYRKGGDVLLRAFGTVRRTLPRARLVLATSEHVPPGLPMDGVEVIEASWNRDLIMDLYRRADVFVLPSRLETWGDVLLEAMAFGLPCIGVAGEPMEDIIDHGVTGSLVQSLDAGTLAETLLPLLRDVELRARWGAAGRERVASQFTWSHVAAKIAPALSGAVEAPAMSAVLH